MNILLIIADTLRQDAVGAYGSATLTPHLDALAAEGVRFTRFLPASYPTGPFRKDLHTGRFTFPYHAWQGGWTERDHLLAEALRRAGYTTALIGDTPANAGFDLRFQHVEFFPGQGGRAMAPLEMELPLPAAEHKLRTPRGRLQAMLETMARWRGEEDRFCPQTMRAAHRWLEHFGRRHQPFFLLVDTFDPHEPWNPPRYYIDRYDPGYQGDELMEPAYSTAEYASPSEIRHMRAMYAGEVTMVDRWIGYLLEGLRAMGLWDDTAVIVTSDHGFYHGEHDLIGKVQLDRAGTLIRRWPLYDAVTRVPLILRIPGLAPGSRLPAPGSQPGNEQSASGHRYPAPETSLSGAGRWGPGACCCDALCQTPDLTATLLELAGAEPPPTLQGRLLLPILDGEATGVRDAAVTSLTYVTDDAVRAPSSFRTDDFLYIYGGDEWGHELYDLRGDAALTSNLFEQQRDTARELHARYLAFLREIECPAGILAGREEFAPKAREALPYGRRI